MVFARSPHIVLATYTAVLPVIGCGAVVGSPEIRPTDSGAPRDDVADAYCKPVCPEMCGSERCITVVADGLGGPFEVVGDDKAVYWTEYTSGRVGMSTVGEAHSVGTLASGMVRPVGIAMDADHVYVADNARGIYAIGREGTTPPKFLGAVSPYTLSVSPTFGSILYSSRAVEGDIFSRAPISSFGKAMAVPYVDGGADFDLGPTAGLLAIIGQQQAGVYAACSTESDDGGVLYLALYNQLPPSYVATKHDNAQSVVSTQKHGLYWTNPTLGALVGSSGVTIATGHAPASADGHERFSRLAVSDTYVFWTSSAEGTVLRTPLAGGMTVTLASEQAGPVGVAVVGTDVYWANYLGGTVMRTTQ
jgi:hypothetical protein